jgi:phosphoglycerate kinase
MNSLLDLDLTNKHVLLRADLNLPCHEGQFSDLTRLERLIPTLTLLLAKGARVLVLSHLGRPNGKDLSLSLAPIAPLMAQLVGQPVHFVSDCIGTPVVEALAGPDNLFLLENARFYPGEEAGDPAFAKALSENGDLFVNDAFSVSHRAHASVVGLTEYLPSYPGLQMTEELAALESALTHPVRPVAAIVGGSKVSTKIELLMHLVTKVDILMIGGGMANTFLKATGVDVGASMAESGCEALVSTIQKQAQESRSQLGSPPS